MLTHHSIQFLLKPSLAERVALHYTDSLSTAEPPSVCSRTIIDPIDKTSSGIEPLVRFTISMSVFEHLKSDPRVAYAP